MTNKRSATLLPVPVKKNRTPGVLYEDNCRGGAFIHKARDWESDCGKCHRRTVSEIFYRALRAVMYRHGCKSMAVTQAIHEIEEELRGRVARLRSEIGRYSVGDMCPMKV